MASEFGSFRKAANLTLPAIGGPLSGAVAGVRIDDPAIVAVLTAQGEGRALAFTSADGQTQYPHHLIRADLPVTHDGAWSWFSCPESNYHNGYTYWYPVTQYGEVLVCWRRHSDGATGRELLETLTLGTGSGIDDHNNGAGLVLPDGKLLVFYSDHNGTVLKCRRQTTAGDPSAWDAAVSINGTDNTSYVLPILLADGRIVLHYRNTTDGYKRYYQVSNNSGATWGPKTAIFQSPDNATRESTIDRPYMHCVASRDGTKIWYLVSDGNPPEVTSPITGEFVNSLRVCYYDTTDGLMHQPTGAPLLGGSFASPPAGGFDTAAIEAVFYADGTASNTYWNWDIQITEDDQPCITGLHYIGFPNAWSQANVVFARFDGAAWIKRELTDVLDGFSEPIANTAVQPFYHGGARLCPNNPDAVMYISWPSADGGPLAQDIWRVESVDRGSTWHATRRLNTLRGGERRCIRPVVPTNHQPELEVLWMEGWYKAFQMEAPANGADGYDHNGYATGIQSYPRVTDAYVAWVRVDMSASPTVIAMHWDHAGAVEQADKAATFATFLYVSDDCHVNRWPCGTVNMASLPAFSVGFVGRWGRAAFDSRQHYLLSNWDSAGNRAHIMMREQAAGDANLAMLYYTSNSFGNIAWSDSFEEQEWFTAIATRNKAVASGALQPYLDGVALTSVTPASAADMPATPSSSQLWIGCTAHSPTLDQYFNGEVGLVFVAPSQLSAAWVDVFSDSNPFNPSWSYGSFGGTETFGGVVQAAGLGIGLVVGLGPTTPSGR